MKIAFVILLVRVPYSFFYNFKAWEDPTLTWSPESYDGISDIVYPRSEVWLPDIVPFDT